MTYVVGFFGKIVSNTLLFFTYGKNARKNLIMQLFFTFIQALPIVCVLAIAIGTSIHLIGYNFVNSIGRPLLIYTLLVLIITKELGPLLVAFVVTARSATAIATELASMVVSHEVEAYISVGVDPIDHLAVPRFLGVTLSLFLLNVYFSIFGLIAPVIMLQLLNPISFSDYLSHILQVLTVSDLLVSILKSIIFGMIISVVSVHFGFSAQRASTEIPQAGLKAVSNSILFIVLADAFITTLFYVL